MLLGSFEVVGCISVCPRCRCVHSGSLGPFGFALRVVGFIWGRMVHRGAPLGSLGSFGVVGSIRVCPGGRWVHLGSLGSFGCALGVIGYIQGR